ncbi:MAG: hypothetical protein QOG42_2052 [Solirubrobacteraceae bacterium]|jgi:hypothetical protein|nr:hypothetical protein [Solirubrobacteraceae bacterium]
MPGSRLHLVDGSELLVTEGDEEAAGLLWSPPDPALRRVREMGYATLTGQDGGLIRLNAAAVMYLTALPEPDSDAVDFG